MNLDLTKTIDEAYELYMPQVRYEIEEFYEFLADHYQNKTTDEYNILEIGTKFGGTFYLWCMMNQSSGLNVSIDWDDGGLHGGVGNLKMDERDERFKEKFHNCEFIRGNSHSDYTFLRFLNLFGFSKEIDNYNITDIRPFLDFLFIDGDHTYKGVKQDFEMYSPFVKKGGLICFHDIKDTPKHKERQVEVAKLWNEIIDLKLPKPPNRCCYGGSIFEFVEFVDNSVDWGGIGALLKI